MKLSRTSVVLLLIQLAIVSSIAAKYLYQRWNCPRVWTRTVAYEPELVMRGRYLSLRLRVDGCGRITPPSPLPENEGNPLRNAPWFIAQQADRYQARLTIDHAKLVAMPLAGPTIHRGGFLPIETNSDGATILAAPGDACDALTLEQPVDFYIPEHAADPSRLKAGEELWIEVTVPPKGPPRPLQLALKQNGVWKPLAFQ
jgi:hypothetical protein